ncbi:S-adenosylmethionine-dependent methyltransferase Rv2258c-like [Physella acuta]|uniref:S-adenosylmethionine-dependent methyltransferase Rv2258c-like n=1 Tax=Physella acuta TaxID=109671 RepID=UPI0027DB0DE0|nr:S-adenosylmethionine-dependent methyltransferase Rv2258c-like [Physella acuta]
MASSERKSLKKKLEEIIHYSTVGFVLSVAQELGILELLVLTDQPMTSQEVANRKELKERYTRELLNCLVCAQIVDVECHGNEHYYNIDREKGSILLDDSLPFMGSVTSSYMRYGSIKKCIQKDGPYGLPYTQNLPSVLALNKLSTLRYNTEVDIILQNTPGLMDELEAGINVIEIGCGMGAFISRLAKRFPASTFTGFDYSSFCLEKGREAISAMNLPNLTMIQLDVFDIPEEMYAKYDFALTNEVIHCLPDPTLGLTNIRKLLRPGCYYVMTEVGPEDDVMLNKNTLGAGPLYCISAFHCVPQTYLDEKSTTHGVFLGKDTAIQYAKDTGFNVVSSHLHSELFVVYVLQVI